jgi:hypothetical protein
MAMTEAPFSVTLKTPRGNLVTVRADSALDWLANLQAAGKSGALSEISSIETFLAGQANPTRPSGAPSGPPATAVAPSSPSSSGQELPSGFGTPKCVECGGETRFAQEGVSKKSGKAYKRYACTANQLHKSTFAV